MRPSGLSAACVRNSPFRSRIARTTSPSKASAHEGVSRIVPLVLLHRVTQVVHDVAAAHDEHALLPQRGKCAAHFDIVSRALPGVDAQLENGDVRFRKDVPQDAPCAVVQAPIGAMEAYERGYITQDMLGDNPVYANGFNWGDYHALVQMVEDMCLRSTPCGSLLTEGSRWAAERLGEMHPDMDPPIHFTAQIKGLELPGYELKGLANASIGFAVSVRGGCHLRNGSYGADMKKTFDRKVYDKLDERGKDIAKGDGIMAVIDSLIICKFTRGIYEKGFPEMAEVYEMVTGLKMSGDDITTAGQRILDLSKCFNIRECRYEGIEPETEDTLPGGTLMNQTRTDLQKVGSMMKLVSVKELNNIT